MYGEGRAAATKGVKGREQELGDGQVSAVLAALTTARAAGGTVGAAAEEQWHYFTTNAARMNYAEWRAGGYPIGSGTVESTCKRLIGARVKGAGMRWSQAGVQAVLTLRAELLSGRWEESWAATRPARQPAAKAA